jgi:hypothetical protein
MNLPSQLGTAMKSLAVQATGSLTLFLRQATPELPALIIQAYQSFGG